MHNPEIPEIPKLEIENFDGIFSIKSPFFFQIHDFPGYALTWAQHESKSAEFSVVLRLMQNPETRQIQQLENTGTKNEIHSTVSEREQKVFRLCCVQ